MSFRDFASNTQSTREYEEGPLNKVVLGDVMAYLTEINAGIGNEKGFSLILLENGEEVFNSLKGVGGYHGVMIKSPHYVGLTVSKEDPEAEFLGAYYLQSVVRKLYELMLGSCWINLRNIPLEINSKLQAGQSGKMIYLLAFGQADEKAVKHKAAHVIVTSTAASFKQDPYGTKMNEAEPFDTSRHSLGEIVFLYDWGRQATYEELESRGMAEVFYYVRNAPSYKNIQPCRFILKDGEAELAVINNENQENDIDAGIMMYMFEGLAGAMGIPCKWHFTGIEPGNKDYRTIAKIEL